MSIGRNIAKFRKAKDLTQTEFGNLLGVSNQAVSKWEMEINMPDVMLLPEIAKALDITLNQLYDIPEDVSKVEVVNLAPHYDLVSNLPWEDDGVIRGVVFEGRKMLTANEIQRIKTTNEGELQSFCFEIQGNPRDVHSEGDITVIGSVMGGANCNDLTVAGNMSGGANCNDVTVGGNWEGGCNCDDLTIGGSFYGGSVIGNDVTVSGDVYVDTLMADSVECQGSIKSKTEADVQDEDGD